MKDKPTKVTLQSWYRHQVLKARIQPPMNTGKWEYNGKISPIIVKSQTHYIAPLWRHHRNKKIKLINNKESKKEQVITNFEIEPLGPSTPTFKLWLP